jgi:hypothetical protein
MKSTAKANRMPFGVCSESAYDVSNPRANNNDDNNDVLRRGLSSWDREPGFSNRQGQRGNGKDTHSARCESLPRNYVTAMRSNSFLGTEQPVERTPHANGSR